MGIRLGDILVSAGIDSKPTDGVLQTANRSIKSAVSGITKMVQGAASMAGALLIANPLALIASGIGGIAQSMIGGNAKFETYNAHFTTLLGSPEAAQQRLAALSEFGARTPFELDQIVRADKILEAFGVHSQEIAQRFGYSGEQIRTIAGDVAAGTGARFEEIASYIGKLAAGSSDDVVTYTISRLQELGVLTRQQLSDMGLKFSKHGQLLSPMDESIGVILQAMEGKFGGLMDVQSSTFNGMISNLSDWLGQVGRILGKPVFDILKQSLRIFLGFVTGPQMIGGLQDFAEQISSWIGSVIAIGKLLITGDFEGGIFGLTEDDPRIEALFQVRDGAMRIASILGSFGQTAGKTDLMGALGTQDAGPIGRLANVFVVVGDALGIVVEVDKLLLNALVLGSDPVSNLAAATDLLAKLIGVDGGSVLSVIYSSIQDVNRVIIDTRDRAAAAFVAAWRQKLWPDLQAVAAWINAELVPIFMVVFSWLMDNLPIAVQTLSDFWLTVLMPAIGMAYDWIKANLVPLFLQLWDWLKVNLPIALQTLSDFWTNTLQPAIQQVWDWMQTSLFPTLQTLWDWLATNVPAALQTLSNFWTNTLWPAIKDVWAWMDGTLFPLFKTLNDFLSATLGKTLEVMAGTWKNTLWPALEKVGRAISTGLKPAVDALERLYSDHLKPLIDRVNGVLGSQVATLLTSYARGFDGMSNAIRWLTDWLGEAAKRMADAELPDWATPHSPTPFEQGLRGMGRVLREAASARLGPLSAGKTVSSMNGSPTPIIHNLGHIGAQPSLSATIRALQMARRA